MATNKSDDPGVLGNLPRSRPGHRSDKRRVGAAAAVAPPAATGAQPKAKPKAATTKSRPASKRATTGATASKRATAAPKRAKAAAAAPKAQPERPAPSPPEAEHGPRDPFTDAVRIAGKVAEAGLKTAAQLLRRLPGR